MKNVGILGSVYSTGNYTLTIADHMKLVMMDSASALTVTVPIGLPDGFSFWLQQNGTGGVTIDTNGRTGGLGGMTSNASRFFPSYPFDTCLCVVSRGNTLINAVFLDPFATVISSNTASQSRNTTTMTNLAGMSYTLLPSCIYDVDFRVAFSTNNVAAALRLGLSALPTGATCHLEGRVWNTNVAGTAPVTQTLLLTPSSIIAAGTASVSGAQQLGTITGKIYVGGNQGTLTPQVSSINTTGLVTIAVGAANMTLTPVFLV